MDKKPLIGVSICAVVLLVLGSLSNVGGIENVKSCDCGDPPCWPEFKGGMGDNNWYVTQVMVSFNGTYNYVNYRINGGIWTEYINPFVLFYDGIYLLEWVCDSNMSDIYSVEIKIDQSSPYATEPLKIRWVGFRKWQFTANVSDDMSGVNRVVFYIANFTDTEPPYQVTWTGFLWWRSLIKFIYSLLGGWIGYEVDVFDNAGNGLPQPSSNYYSAY